LRAIVAARVSEEQGDSAVKLLEVDPNIEAQIVMLEKRRVLARQGLVNASLSCNIMELESAINEGSAAGLAARELSPCRLVLHHKQQKIEARALLERALQSCRPEDLLAAVEVGIAAGLAAEELSVAELALTEVSSAA